MSIVETIGYQISSLVPPLLFQQDRRDAWVVESADLKSVHTYGASSFEDLKKILPVVEVDQKCVSCSLENMLSSLKARIFSFLDSHLQQQKMLSWGKLMAHVAERLQGKESIQPVTAKALRPAFLDLRQHAFSDCSVPPALRELMNMGYPFILTRNKLLKLERMPTFFQDHHYMYLLVEVKNQEQCWFQPIIESLVKEFEILLQQQEETAFYVRFLRRIANGVIQGQGKYKNFLLKKDLDGNIRLIYQVGEPTIPFITEVPYADQENKYILWSSPFDLYVTEAYAKEIDISFASVRVLLSQNYRMHASSFYHHTYVSRDQNKPWVCMAKTPERLQSQASGGYDIVDHLLETKLRAACRVLKYGHQKRNNDRGFRSFQDEIKNHEKEGLEPPYVLLTKQEALEYQQRHPSTEIVWYDGE